MVSNFAPFYVMATAFNAGSSVWTAALVHALKDAGHKVGVFRPVQPALPTTVVPSDEGDPVLEALIALSGSDIPFDDCCGIPPMELVEDRDGAISTIVKRFNAVRDNVDIMVVLGTDYSNPLADEFNLNAELALNLGARLLLAESAKDRDATTLNSIAWTAVKHLRKNRLQPAALLINRVAADSAVEFEEFSAEIRDSLEGLDLPVYTAPDVPQLHAPTLYELRKAVNGTLVNNVSDELLSKEATSVVVAGVSNEHILDHIEDQCVVVAAADRTSTLEALIENQKNPDTPNIAGIICPTGTKFSNGLDQIAADNSIPVITTDMGTYQTAAAIDATRGILRPSATNKLDLARKFADEWMQITPLDELLATPAPTAVTPLMFQYNLLERAREDIKHIVLPEGEDDRILQAAHIILEQGFAKLTILGDPDSIATRAKQLELNIDDAELLNPETYEDKEKFAETYFELRKHKGISMDDARQKMTDISYFATMMIYLGMADGMVSGAAHTTAHTIRPSFEIIKTKPGVSTVSSIFLMCLRDEVLAFGDCAVNINPTAEQLADIAASSAETASQFGVEPRVAMLSYSTGSSGAGEDVEKVREAVEILQGKDLPYPVDGPIQFDAAVDETVAAAKAPDSEVAGKATVLVFPDLNTGNNTYKAVQRTAGAVAVGPVLQGLKKPINDLSRGALVEDIVNTVAVTATQAQAIQEN